MKEDKLVLKVSMPSMGLCSLLLQRIISCKKEGEEIIPFPKIFSKICCSFQINKQSAWELLYLIRDFGFIEIIYGHGIKVNFEGIKK